MSNFKIGDLIVPNDKFYEMSSSIIGAELGVLDSFVDDLKNVFSNDSYPLRITYINKDRLGRVWLDVCCESRHIALDKYGDDLDIDMYSYLAEYFELYEEKKKSNNLVLDYKLIDKLIWTTTHRKGMRFYW